MKKIILLLLLILVFITGVSCGASPALGFGQNDLYLNIGGARYNLNMDVAEVIAALGPDYSYAEARSCDYDGLDKTFIYDNAEFYTFPKTDGDMVCEIYSESTEASTSKGIFVGAQKEDVLAAYGAECEDTGYQLIYTVEEGSLCFDMENGKVKAFYVTIRPF